MWACKDIQENMDLNICQWHAPMLHLDNLPAFNHGIKPIWTLPFILSVSWKSLVGSGYDAMKPLDFQEQATSRVFFRKWWDKPWWTHALTETSLRWWRDLSRNWKLQLVLDGLCRCCHFFGLALGFPASESSFKSSDVSYCWDFDFKSRASEIEAFLSGQSITGMFKKRCLVDNNLQYKNQWLCFISSSL